MWNNLKTTVLLAGLTGLLLAIGQWWGGQRGLTFALVLAAVMNLGSYFFSDKIALATSGAQPISREEGPRIYEIVERLAAKANVPVPKIYMIPTDSPNAFATGRYWGELFGGFGGGGRDDDRRGGALSALAMIIVAPLAATLIQLAISRSREYEADATGAGITGNPQGLASALQKIDQWSKQIPMRVPENMAHLYCAQPLTAGEIFSSLFSTHPPIPKRIQRLIGRDFV